MANGYRITGAPLAMEIEDFKNAKNLCADCLKCEYCEISTVCRHSDIADDSASINYECIGVEELHCKLHKKIAPYAHNEMTPNCEYRPIRMAIKSVVDPLVIDIKTAFREAASKYKQRSLTSKYYYMPPNVFMKLSSLLQKDDLVYFGTGESKSSTPYGYTYHATLERYLEDPAHDRDTLCLRADSITEQMYIHLTSELSTSELSYGVVYIPSIDFICFGDEEFNDYNYGYVYFANDTVADYVQKEHENTVWSKYVYELLDD